MTKRLDVYLHQRLAGHLDQDDSGQLSFRYAAGWLGSSAPTALSHSLPVRAAPFGNRETRPFFAGLLPEADKRDLIARRLGISGRNDFAMLDRIGGECAGAVALLQPGTTPTSPGAAAYRYLDDEQLAGIIDSLSDRPLLAGDSGIRLSLAGAQDKLPVLLRDDRIAVPLDGSPSSHILKPPIRRFEDTAHNEAFCLALAKELRLHVISGEMRSASGRAFLLVERYDRALDADGNIRRLHQEDFCQALSVAPETKYQAEGGPSLKQCFDLVRASTARPAVELMRLLDAVLFNVLVGNNDAHAKNFSLLNGTNGLELAPLYDLTCTVAYPDLSPRFAMKIGDQYLFDELYPRHWDRFAKEVGLGVAQVRRRLRDMAERGAAAASRTRDVFRDRGHHRPIIDAIVAKVSARCQQVLVR